MKKFGRCLWRKKQDMGLDSEQELYREVMELKLKKIAKTVTRILLFPACFLNVWNLMQIY